MKITIDNSKVDPERKLNYRFYKLNLTNRLRVSLECNLIYYSDENLSLSQLFSKVFQRAKEQNKFEELWNHTHEWLTLDVEEENPFLLKK